MKIWVFCKECNSNVLVDVVLVDTGQEEVLIVDKKDCKCDLDIFTLSDMVDESRENDNGNKNQ